MFDSLSNTPENKNIGNFPAHLEYEPYTGVTGSYAFQYNNIANIASTEIISNENILNSLRLHQYRTKMTEDLLQLIDDSNLEYGYSSQLDFFLKARLSENAFATKEWLNSLFVRYFNNEHIAVSMLRTIAHIDYDEIAPQGPTMALAALSSSNQEIRECGIRAFENWANYECLSILKSITVPEKWMQSYLSQVISDLEKELGVV